MRALPFVILIIILTGCSVQKRVYQRGYYVSWKHENAGSSKAHGKSEITKANSAKPAGIEMPADEATVPAIREHSADLPVLAAAGAELLLPPEDDCDVMIFKDGTELKVKIIERSPYEFKYKRCDLQDGPMYTVKHSTLFMIKYANGTREVFTTETATSSAPPQRPMGPKKVQPMAVMSLVFGILGIWPLTFIGSLVALILGTNAKKKIERNPEKYKGEGMAIAGQVLGIVMLSLLGLVLFFVLLALMIGAFI